MQNIRIIRFLLTLTILTASWNIVNSALGKVDPPNYNFSLGKLEPFTPNKNYIDLEKELGKGEIIEDTGETKIYRFMISHVRYKFPVYVQEKKGVILDFYARFPTYFLHDLFHQSLINKFGKQDKYHRQENDAVYIWNNKNGVKIVYSGACTVTCFPNYVSYMKVQKEVGEYTPLLEKFSKSFTGTFPK